MAKKRNLFALFLLGVGGCSASVPPRPDGVPFDPVGEWRASDGFTLTVGRNGTYQVCDEGRCDSARYVGYYNYIVLRDFFTLGAAQRMIRRAEIFPTCEERCAGPPNPEFIYPNDLSFFGNVAPVDAARKCGDSDCVILGNVEVAYGTLRKARAE